MQTHLVIPDTIQFEYTMHRLLGRRPTYFDVSTFGVPSLKAINRLCQYSLPIRILVGIPAGLTKEQAWGYNDLRRLYKDLKITFRFAKSHHAKLYVAEHSTYDEVIIGSRNIGDSSWKEVGVVFTDTSKACRKLFLQWWNESSTSAEVCRKQ